MTIEQYLALNNPRAVAEVLEANGSRKIDKKNIMDVLVRFTEKKGDYAFEQLAKIDTPYRRLILSQIEETKSGCSGCGGTCGGEKKSNCCGVDGGEKEKEKVLLTTAKEVSEPVKTEGKPPVIVLDNNKKEHNNIMVAGLVLLGVIAIAVVVRK